jgi:hypothetical protein
MEINRPSHHRALIILTDGGVAQIQMPAFAADFFGPKNVGPIYGLMLTAWDFASAFGPLLIAHMRETAGSYRGGFHVIAGVMAISTLLPILVASAPDWRHPHDGNRIASSPERGGCDRLTSDNRKSSTRAVAELLPQAVT